MTCLPRRMLSALGRERAVRAELRAITGEQATLRRVAALAAGGGAPGAVFAAVAEEAGNVLPGADAALWRWLAAGAGQAAACWPGRRLPLGGQDVSAQVFQTGRPARRRPRRWRGGHRGRR